MHSLKFVLISTGALSMALILKLFFPLITDYVSEIPSFWSFLISWLKPPYLYIVINCIIISLVASSRLQQKLEDRFEMVIDSVVPVPPPPAVKASADVKPDYTVDSGGVILDRYSDDEDDRNMVWTASEAESEGNWEPKGLEMEKNESHDQKLMEMSGGDEAEMLRITWSRTHGKDSSELLVPNEKGKPPVSSRPGNQKSLKAGRQGKTLGVSKPKRNDTLESTWKAITEGRSMPLSRHLKKSDTWEMYGRRNPPLDENTPPAPLMKKSETFNDRNSSSHYPSSGSRRLRKEPSLSQDELNKRVEAFIKKVNEEMRLQRLESLDQYHRGMISSGGY